MSFFKKHKVLSTVILVIIILLLFMLGIIISIINSFRKGAIEVVTEEEVKEEVLLSENVPIFEEVQKKPEVFNVLLVGIDTRSDGFEDGRSDSMILVSYNEEDNTATLMSFMRDSLVEIPGYGLTKLGHSYAYGGVGLTINTLNKVYDLDIQSYVTINFENLQNVIDKIGGIEVPITAEEAELYNAYGRKHIKEGVNLLNGEDALMHARNRSIDNDFGRTRRQRSVLNGIYRKVQEKKDAETLLPLINYCMKQVKTNMDVNTIFDMATKVLSTEHLVVQQTSIPVEGTYTFEKYKGMSVINVDIEANKKIIEEYLYY